ncbi:uncharacterized protein OCT59_004572 [Rhizophagus irregularis]|uniref:uncharacterized protein n=1 Tax=Rhizophagus irregularis TaxID=588596 RepID=UPI00332E4148|nr:hypothetical protein OCT59_004572 [Rhizophagus irregularis]
MDGIKLSDDVFEQIKDFDYWELTEEQESLIDKLITDKELKEHYKNHGLCKECKRFNTDYDKYCNFVESNILVYSSTGWIVRCFGITKDTKTNDFMMVMELKDGSLRQYLNNYFISLNWHKKLHNLQAPEVLRGNESTHKSDIYGFGIIAYEICTGFPLYYDIAHDEFLAMKICKGLRPKSNYKIPKFIFDIINQCWDADPLKRPNADELTNLFYELFIKLHNSEVDSVIYRQVKEADEINKKSSSTFQSPLSSTSTLSYITHPQAVYTSRLLDFKNLPEPENADKNDDLEYSNSLKMDFTKLDINSKDESNINHRLL